MTVWVPFLGTSVMYHADDNGSFESGKAVKGFHLFQNRKNYFYDLLPQKIKPKVMQSAKKLLNTCKFILFLCQSCFEDKDIPTNTGTTYSAHFVSCYLVVSLDSSNSYKNYDYSLFIS